MPELTDLVRDVTDKALAPLDATLDLIEQTGEMLRRQAEALEAASTALAETAALMRAQAELYDATLGQTRPAAKLVKRARAPRKRSAK